MNRSRRPPQNKNFVSGGVYDGRQTFSGNQLGNPANQAIQSNQGIQNNQPIQNSPVVAQRVSRNQSGQQYQTNGTPKSAPLQPPPLPPKMEDDHINVGGNIVQEDKKMDETSLFDEGGKLQYKNIFRVRKKSSVRTKEKRIRVNRQLRKTLIPKNALMALHEVNGIQIGDFSVDSSSSGGFVAVVTVNDKQYEGKGNSKTAAKNNASEKALRDYVLEKMREKPRVRKTSLPNDEAMDTSEGNNVENGNDDESNATGVIDDVPMANLASFAIYKLFVEWENEGYAVPELRVAHQANSGSDAGSTQESPSAPKVPKPPTIRNELPSNWESIHPSTLLCMMRPGLQYRELGVVGEKPNVLQRMSVTVDDVVYASSGRSKKVARRNVAVSVLNSLFGTNFAKEEPCED